MLRLYLHCLSPLPSPAVIRRLGPMIWTILKVKWFRYRPGVAHRVGRGIALLFHDRGTRRGWVVSSTSRPHFIPGKDPVPILQEAGWAAGPVWTVGISCPHRDSIPDRPAHSPVAIPTELPGPFWTVLFLEYTSYATLIRSYEVGRCSGTHWFVWYRT